MSVSLSGSSVIPFIESNATPAVSYTNQDLDIRLFSLLMCSDESLWVCVNNSDQANLVWKNIAYAA